MLVDALTMANDELDIKSSVAGPEEFWKVCVILLIVHFELASAFNNIFYKAENTSEMSSWMTHCLKGLKLQRSTSSRKQEILSYAYGGGICTRSVKPTMLTLSSGI